ncbi:signal recognition particle-docking protein FtsY [Anaeroselena agilis]|uniref:Signal recognition particle receptor FtsY n=1 Tax=Anaeroselena agilis TaxID=3063788 RepID=A0ABU3NWQ1_9FIRM|nr:signal recognition particle-docking protein FtsY [Selenomonadales bacterium 4137-cl]
MGFFDRLKEGLTKTRKGFTEKVEQLVSGYATIDDEFLDDLEAILLAADVGVKTVAALLADIKSGIKAKQINGPDDLVPFLKTRIAAILAEGEGAPREAETGPTVIMVVGVNGVGKTTTIAKLGHYYREQGRRVLLAAGDTFRAAASEQLEIWGSRIGAEVIRHKEGSDPAAVAFDAVQAAKARSTDLLIVDTAGRLHTKSNLMEELKKVHRVIARELPGAPHEVLLVLDATTGQNALSQARLFKEAVEISGLVLTKLDGTAKGGVIVAVKSELGVPVKWIGVGEKMEDLRPFVASDFAAALFGDR